MSPGAAPAPLEQQIGQWRAYLRRRRAITGPDVDELEAHLRDQVGVLTQSGLAEDEAFLIAVKRMGSLDALSREFAREHSERLWKQLVIAPDGDAAPGAATRNETLVAFALATALSDDIGRPWASVGLYTMATGVAWSRLNDNRHWLSDVAAGAVVGVTSAKLVNGHWRIFNLHPPQFLIGPGTATVAWELSF